MDGSKDRRKHATNGHGDADVEVSTNGHDRGWRRPDAGAAEEPDAGAVERPALRDRAGPVAWLALYALTAVVALFLSGVGVIYLAALLESTFVGAVAVFTVGGLLVAASPAVAQLVVTALLGPEDDLDPDGEATEDAKRRPEPKREWP